MELREFSTFTKQGNVGHAYYSKLGYTISIPLTDSQDYDIIVDTGNTLLKVQTTTCRRDSGNYQLNLKVSGTGKVKTFDLNKCDLIFAMTEQFEFYSIPRSEISAASSITLGEKYLPFKVSLIRGRLFRSALPNGSGCSSPTTNKSALF